MSMNVQAQIQTIAIRAPYVLIPMAPTFVAVRMVTVEMAEIAQVSQVVKRLTDEGGKELGGGGV